MYSNEALRFEYEGCLVRMLVVDGCLAALRQVNKEHFENGHVMQALCLRVLNCLEIATQAS